MMRKEEIINGIIASGQDPNDFEVKIFESGYSVTPKWFYETKQIAEKENKPIKEDVDTVAETLVYTADDFLTLADTAIYLMREVERLNYEMEVLKNG